MSGICGVVALDGGIPERSNLASMLAQLATRGPDGSHQWQGGPAALGHTLLATTPEALIETLPLSDPETGCTITADCRLDNRDELLAALDPLGADRVIGDGELILRAYLRWGEECPTRLLGDFAFAIWDPRGAKLFCARDHMGMRQLIYHHQPGRLFVFATEAETVRAHREVPRQINEARIADFLDDLEGTDLTSTFFEGMFRLPPAHRLSVDATGLNVRRYWKLAPQPELRLNNEQAYLDAFLAVFAKAISCRLRSAGAVGAMLSGGIDSSSVAAMAGRLLASDGKSPLSTFSAVGPDPATCPETGAIHVAQGLPGIRPTVIDHSGLDEWSDDLWRLAQETGEPFDEHMTLIRVIYLSARKAGVKVVLDGAGADVVLTRGNRIAEDLRKGRFRQAWTDAWAEEAYWKIPHYRFRALLGGAWLAFAPPAIRRAKRKLASKLADASTGPEINRSFAKRANLKGRRTTFRSHAALHGLPEIEWRIQAITHPNLVVARERYDRTAGAVGVEPRDPFMDVRFIEFCLSVPADLMQRDGWPKAILRLAAASLVPDAIRWRQGKEHLGWTFTQALFQRHPTWREMLQGARSRLKSYVNLPSDKEPFTPARLERLIGLFLLSRWLQRNE